MAIGLVLHTWHAYKASDLYLRNRVFKLTGNGASCSGVQVTAPTGKVYVLTAGHCAALVVEGKVYASGESGQSYVLDFIEEDQFSDLMLLSAPPGPGVSIASGLDKHEHVRTLTHGRGMPTYRTDGEYVMLDFSTVPLFPILSFNDQYKCNQVKEQVIIDSFTGVRECALVTFQSITTADVIPGSSGGPLFDDDGKLAGIVSATDGKFSSFVTISDMVAFLRLR